MTPTAWLSKAKEIEQMNRSKERVARHQEAKERGAEKLRSKDRERLVRDLRRFLNSREGTAGLRLLAASNRKIPLAGEFFYLDGEGLKEGVAEGDDKHTCHHAKPGTVEQVVAAMCDEGVDPRFLEKKDPALVMSWIRGEFDKVARGVWV